MQKKLLLFAVMFVFLIQTVSAATIHGTVYDLYLEKQKGAIVTINTLPEQTYVAKDGIYSFGLNAGSYEIKAKYYRFNELAGYASENITINEDGDYVIDLILFPDFGEEEEILNESEIDINGIIDEESVWDKILFGGFIALFIKAIIVLISMIVVLIILRNVYKKFKKISEKAERDDEKDLSDEVLDFIAAKQITTQKEIRSKFFSSEAMISLILTELEHKGKIEKIKKGRGNIIKMLGNH